MVSLHELIAPVIHCALVKFEVGLLFPHSRVDLGGVIEAPTSEFGTEGFERHWDTRCGTKAYSHKVWWDAVFCGRLLEEGLPGGAMFEIGVEKIKGVAGDPRVADDAVFAGVVGLLYSCVILPDVLVALIHRAVFSVGKSEVMDGDKVAVSPGI